MKPTLSTTRPLTLGMTPPWVIAHRGNSSEAPENTEPAFIQALEAGVEAIELDVQLSKDGLPIVWHDRDLKKLGLEGTVADHPAMVLKGSDAGSWFSDAYEGQAPLALQEVLRRYGGQTRLLIEIKAREHDVKSGRHLELASKV